MVVTHFNPSTPPNILELQLSFKSLTVPSIGTEETVHSINIRRGKTGQFTVLLKSQFLVGIT